MSEAENRHKPSILVAGSSLLFESFVSNAKNFAFPLHILHGLLAFQSLCGHSSHHDRITYARKSFSSRESDHKHFEELIQASSSVPSEDEIGGGGRRSRRSRA